MGRSCLWLLIKHLLWFTAWFTLAWYLVRFLILLSYEGII